MARIPRIFWLKLLRGTLSVLLAVTLASLIGLWWLFGTSSGVQWLVATALPYAKPHLPPQFQLEVTDVTAEDIADLSIGAIRVADSEGLWLEITGLRLDWNPSALWYGAFSAEEVSAERIRLHRLPEMPEEEATTVQQQIEDITRQLADVPALVNDLGLPLVRIHSLDFREIAIESDLVDVPSRFSLSGTLDLIDSPASLSLDLSSLEGVATTANARITGSPADAALSLRWLEDSGGLLGNAMMLASPSPVSLSLDSSLQGAILVTSLEAKAGDAPLMQAGIRLPLEEDPDISWHVTLPRPALFAPLESLTAPVEATGFLRDVAIHALIRTEAVTLGEEASLKEVVAEATLRLDDGAAPLALDTSFRAGHQAKGGQPVALALVMRAEGEANEWHISMLNASMGPDITATANGDIDLGAGDASLSGSFSVPQMDGHYQADARNLWESPQGKAAIVLEKLKQPLPSPADKVLVLPLTLNAETAGEAKDGALPDIRFTLESQNLQGKGMAHPAATGKNTLLSAELKLGGLPLPLDFALTHLASNEGHVKATSEGLTLSSDYAIGEDRITLSAFLLDAGADAQLRGGLSIDTQKGLASGEVKGHLRSTAPFASLGLELPHLRATRGELRLSLSTPKQQQQAALDYRIGSLSMDGGDVAKDVSILAEATLPADKPVALSALVKAKDIVSPVALDALTLRAKGDFSQLALDLKGGNEAAKTDFAIAGHLALQEAIAFTFETIGLQWDKNRLALEKPSTFTYAENGMTLTETALRINEEARVTARAAFSGSQAEGLVTVRRLPMRILPVATLKDVQGTLAGKMSIKGSPRDPVADLQVQISGLQQNYPDMTHIAKQPLSVVLRGQLQQQVITAQLSANAPDVDSFAAASLTLPVQVSLAPDAFRFTPKGTIDAAVKTDLVLGPFLPLLTPDGVYGTGHLVSDLRLRGALENPIISGKIDLHSGLIEVLPSGTTVADLVLQAEAKGNRIVITEGRATDGEKGKLAFSGSLGISPTLPMDVTAGFDHFVAARHTNATATLSGDIDLKGDLTDALLAGDLQVNAARITIQQGNSGGSVAELEVVEVDSLDEPIATPEMLERTAAEREAAREKRRRERPFAHNLEMKVGIRAENQIFLEGFGLNAELKGNVDITGTAARPNLAGKMETVRGRWEFFGRTFVITRGEAILNENNLAAPVINLRAEVDASNIVAIAEITGTTARPDIKFSSIPALPQDEILARVMFGSNLSSISPFQALQLADMLRTLSGHGGGGLSPLSKLQNTLGIDELKVNNDGGNGENMTVGVGKYLQENIYLEVEGGAGENSGKVSLEVDITPNISLETEARQNAETAVRLNYKYDY